MAILPRFKTFLRGRKKAPKLIEQPKPSLEECVVASPLPFKGVAFFCEVTTPAIELVLLNALSEAAHHPQVLALRTSLKLNLVDEVLPTVSPQAGGPIIPVVEALALPVPVEDINPSSPSTPLPEYPGDGAALKPDIDANLTVGLNTKPSVTEIDTKGAVALHTQRRSLHINDFNEEGYLGAGAWGYVHLFRHRATGQRVAIKAIQKQLVEGQEEQVLREQATLRAVSGQTGVLDLLGSFQDDATFYLVTRYYAGGDLLGMLEQMGPLPEPVLVFCAAQLLVCVERIHACGVIHRDLKPANIFLDSKINFAIGDFGLAIPEFELKAGKKEICGTMEYFSRDIWQGAQYSRASDIWAYGAIVFEMALGRRMWDSSKVKSLKQAKNKAIGTSLREFIGADVISHELNLFLDEIFENDDNDRPTIPVLKKHPFFASIDWEALEKGGLQSPIFLPEDLEDEEASIPGSQFEPPFDDDEDIEGAFPAFNYTSDILIPAPTSTPVPVPEIDVSEDSSVPTPVIVDVAPESVENALGLVGVEAPALEASPDTMIDSSPELEVPLPESIIVDPEVVIPEPGYVEFESREGTSLIDSAASPIEPEFTPSAPRPRSIDVFEPIHDYACSIESIDISLSADATLSSSDESSAIHTPAFPGPTSPIIASEPSFPPLCGAFQDMPQSTTSLASMMSYPDIAYPLPSFLPSQPLLLPGGDMMRHPLTVEASPVAIMEPQRAEIVHVFGDEVRNDQDADWEHFPDATSSAEVGKRKRFVEKIKRLSKVPRSLSRKF